MKLLFVQVGFVLNLFMMQAQEPSQVIYEPIGVFHTAYTSHAEAPRQGRLKPENKATIEIYSPHQEALDGLETYDYIIVVYHLHKIKSWDTMVTPPGSQKQFGLFATRTPRRPNPIGFSVVELNKIENGILHVSGVDAFDATPVLDIKPYFSDIDCVTNVTNKKNEILPEQ
jgi:formylmethanofuran dehydrogenase subunit E